MSTDGSVSMSILKNLTCRQYWMPQPCRMNLSKSFWYLFRRWLPSLFTHDNEWIISLTFRQAKKLSSDVKDIFLFADTCPDPWHDPCGGVEAKGLSYLMSVTRLQSQEHIPSLHGGECMMRCEMMVTSLQLLFTNVHFLDPPWSHNHKLAWDNNVS